MHARAWLVGAVFALGCASESLNQSSDPDPEPAPTSDPTPSPTATSAPVIEGDFAAPQAYPPGPYGYGVGAVIANLEFVGWRDPVAANYDVNLLEHLRL